jgi:beta-glucuronidase
MAPGFMPHLQAGQRQPRAVKTVGMTRDRLLILPLLALSCAACAAAEHLDAFSLAGTWRFAPDPLRQGLAAGYHHEGADRSLWRAVEVPHTWQVERGYEFYFGPAWYAREVPGHPEWKDRLVQLEFDAVYRDVRAWVNGHEVGTHIGSGYTPFAFDVTSHWRTQGRNLIVLVVDNRFSTNALPYGNSFDWPNDGGILRDLRVRALPRVHIRHLLVHAEPAADFASATLDGRVRIAGHGTIPRGMTTRVRVWSPGGELVGEREVPVAVTSTNRAEVRFELLVPSPALWHFDQPRLYRLECELAEKKTVWDRRTTSFGIRKVEVKPGRYILNGESMRLMGVEWMPGSDPRYGLAEPRRLQQEILAEMKHLNCVLTRFHWQQDASVFDFCDREGILVQEEVPAWGRHPLAGEHIAALQDRHLADMILPHFNHPSIYAWGLCNEILAQTEEGHAFVRRGRDVARRLDPHRLLTYASNSLHNNPDKDAAGHLDFLEWNDYYDTWFGGSSAEIAPALDRIHQAWPNLGLVVSEYGLCECHPKNPKGDDQRIALLRSHTEAYRKHPAVAGAIYFNYNDYRTHIGDKGECAFQQRVHGVVDLFRRRKPSFEALREESSPIRALTVGQPEGAGDFVRAEARIRTRALADDLPAYTLRGYDLVWTAYDDHGLPWGSGRRRLDDLAPGSDRAETVGWTAFSRLARIQVEIFRPTGYSVHSAERRVEQE